MWSLAFSAVVLIPSQNFWACRSRTLNLQPETQNNCHLVRGSWLAFLMLFPLYLQLLPEELNKFSFSVQWCLNNSFILSSSLFLLACGNHNTEEWKYMSTVVITQWILIWTDTGRYESVALSNWKKSINKTSSTFSASDNGHIPGFSTSSGFSFKNSILRFTACPSCWNFPLSRKALLSKGWYSDLAVFFSFRVNGVSSSTDLYFTER